MEVATGACFRSRLPIARLEDNRNIRGKVVVQTGAADVMAPPDPWATFEVQMNAANVDWRMIVYRGVRHVFTAPGADDYGMLGLRLRDGCS